MNEERQWQRIPGFNGYEMDQFGLVRSMKNMYANPGHFLKRYKGRGNEYYYKLSDNNNHRKNVTVTELQRLIDSDPHHKYRGDNEISLGGRNKVFTDTRKPKKPDPSEYVSLDMSSLIEDDE